MNWLVWLIIIAAVLYIGFGFFLGWALEGIGSSDPTFMERLKFALTYPLMFFGR